MTLTMACEYLTVTGPQTLLVHWWVYPQKSAITSLRETLELHLHKLVGTGFTNLGIPVGKLSHSHGQSPSLSSVYQLSSLAIFNSYVTLQDGTSYVPGGFSWIFQIGFSNHLHNWTFIFHGKTHYK